MSDKPFPRDCLLCARKIGAPTSWMLWVERFWWPRIQWLKRKWARQDGADGREAP